MHGTPVIYVDVDDTLVRSFGTKQIPMSSTVAVVRELHRRGAILYCWSRGGDDYARRVAGDLGIEGCFRAYLWKPMALIDDAEFAALSVIELPPSALLGGDQVRLVDDLIAQIAAR